MEKYSLVISTVKDYENIIDVIKEERVKVRNAVFADDTSPKEQRAFLEELAMIDYYLSRLDKKKNRLQNESS